MNRVWVLFRVQSHANNAPEEGRLKPTSDLILPLLILIRYLCLNEVSLAVPDI